MNSGSFFDYIYNLTFFVDCPKSNVYYSEKNFFMIRNTGLPLPVNGSDNILPLLKECGSLSSAFFQFCFRITAISDDLLLSRMNIGAFHRSLR